MCQKSHQWIPDPKPKPKAWVKVLSSCPSPNTNRVFSRGMNPPPRTHTTYIPSAVHLYPSHLLPSPNSAPFGRTYIPPTISNVGEGVCLDRSKKRKLHSHFTSQQVHAEHVYETGHFAYPTTPIRTERVRHTSTPNTDTSYTLYPAFEPPQPVRSTSTFG
eukprot:NODE_656_length_1458_cov_114.292406_g491_i0.p1 GENE.NODE_656_length_1458_cov_114.292406_g491_i0~~NODE_656_length_1458_cov_114.292406_g491_i0.p1  ORF type:complete len:160 (+),score=25.77 NODE_656_length_1458_cov_114.292406_g491_i0:655-1134(+)